MFLRIVVGYLLLAFTLSVFAFSRKPSLKVRPQQELRQKLRKVVIIVMMREERNKTLETLVFSFFYFL